MGESKLNDLNAGTTKQRLYQKNNQNLLKISGLRALSKLPDLKSYSGRSMTLQPISRGKAGKVINTHRMSLRDVPRGSPTAFVPNVPPEPKSVRSKSSSPLRDKDRNGNVPKTPLVLHRRTVSKSHKSTFGQNLSALIHSWGK